MKQDIEEFFPNLIELCRQQDHDDEDCPQDDTCECDNIKKLNDELRKIDALVNRQ